MVDLVSLRAVIADAPDSGPAAQVSKAWLKAVERQLTAAQAMSARVFLDIADPRA